MKIARIARGLVGAAALGIPALALAQGSLNFNNYIPGKDTASKLPAVDAPVYVDFSDVRCDNTYYIAIFGGAAGTAPAAMVSATWAGTNVVKSFNTGAGAGYVKNGQNVQWTSMPPGSLADVQLRVWSASLGATYDTALAAFTANPGAGRMGSSDILRITLGNPSLPVQPRLGSDPDPAYAVNSASPGLTAFYVGSPEPSVVALGGLGLAGALLMRRRK